MAQYCYCNQLIVMNNSETEAITQQLEALHAESIVTLHTGDKTIICDYMVIATANSHRQMQYIANELLKAHGGKRQHHENEEEHWVLVDLGNVMVHIMTKEARVAIDLESLWSDRS